jgi:hypothetical protein
MKMNSKFLGFLKLVLKRNLLRKKRKVMKMSTLSHLRAMLGICLSSNLPQVQGKMFIIMCHHSNQWDTRILPKKFRRLKVESMTNLGFIILKMEAFLILMAISLIRMVMINMVDTTMIMDIMCLGKNISRNTTVIIQLMRWTMNMEMKTTLKRMTKKFIMN